MHKTLSPCFVRDHCGYVDWLPAATAPRVLSYAGLRNSVMPVLALSLHMVSLTAPAFRVDASASASAAHAPVWDEMGSVNLQGGHFRFAERKRASVSLSRCAS
jgi:hypothetical protein